MSRPNFLFCLLSFAERGLLHDRDERVERGIKLIDGVQALAGQLNRRYLAVPNQFRGFGDGAELHSRYLKSCAAHWLARLPIIRGSEDSNGAADNNSGSHEGLL